MSICAETIRMFNETRIPQGVVSLTPSNTISLASPIRDLCHGPGYQNTQWEH